MTSLTEVYEGGNGAGLRRLYAGLVLFGVGAVLLVVGIVIAATELYQLFGLGTFEARELAGILGGIGLPALLIGTMTVLPRAERLVRVGAAVGAGVCLLGVALFRSAYPVDWVGGSGETSMTLVVAAVYFAGAIVTSWCLFASVASFKARNDPGGTVTLEITKGGETRVVEVSNDNLRGALGGIGLLGGTPDGEVETQTNRGTTATGGAGRSPSASATGARSSTTTASPSSTSSSPSSTSRSSGPSSSSGPSRSSGTSGGSSFTRGGRSRGTTSRGSSGGLSSGSTAGVTDGGAAASDDTFSTPGSDDAEFLDEPSPTVGDTYCGNCAHFRYARTDDGLVPYCGLHSEAMDDMEACEQWTPNH